MTKNLFISLIVIFSLVFMTTCFVNNAFLSGDDLNKIINDLNDNPIIPMSSLMVTIPGTTNFLMGYPTVAEPEHSVSSLSGFEMCKYEVSYKKWQDVYIWATAPERLLQKYSFQNPGDKGSDNSGDPEQPVTRISWRDAVAWCNALSEKEGLTPCYYTDISFSSDTVYRDSIDDQTGMDNQGGHYAYNCVDWTANGYRLPTEAEWEYVARKTASSYTDGYKFSGDNDTTSDYAWYNANSGGHTHPVGSKKSNSLGIHDMSGNVSEWCWDWFGEYKVDSPYIDADTKGPESSLDVTHLIRGGGFGSNDKNISTSVRNSRSPGDISIQIGFRIVKNIVP